MAINLVYNGELDISSRLAEEVRWFRGTGTRLWAADGLRGLEVEDKNSSSRQLQPNRSLATYGRQSSGSLGWRD